MHVLHAGGTGPANLTNDALTDEDHVFNSALAGAWNRRRNNGPHDGQPRGALAANGNPEFSLC